MSHSFETNFELVQNFMSAFGQEIKDEPVLPDWNTCALRLDLITEEVKELEVALANENLIDIADALTDILYVVYGAGHAFGIDLDACFEEVHRSNMSKLGQEGKPVYREDGKVLKGPDYFDPDLASILEGA
jgi:predicted HAD superfamily Cof-like phosphohydrolase